MTRRALVVLASLAVLLTAAPPVTATESPADCSQDDQADAIPPNGGRVTVTYDAHNLIDSAGDHNYAVEAATIASAVKAEAEEAYSVYASLSFGNYLPTDVVIALKCRTSNPFDSGRAWTLWIPPVVFGTGHYLIELPVDSVRNEILRRNPSLSGTEWKTPKFDWVELVHHEVFHTIQYEILGGDASFYIDYLARSDKSIMESTATAATDLFGPDLDDPSVVGDDLGRADLGDSYWSSVESFFNTLSKPTVDTAGDSDAYLAAATFQYWGERFGSQTQNDLEQRVGGFLRDLVAADGVRTEAMGNAIGSDVFTALRDFYVAAYAQNRTGATNTYRILDGVFRNDGTPDSALAYPELAIATGDQAALGASFSNQSLGRATGRVYQVDLSGSPGIVEVDLQTYPQLWPPAWTPLYVALVLETNGGSANVVSSNFYRSSTWFSDGTVTQIIDTTGYDRLGIVVVSSEADALYDLSTAAIGQNVALDIVKPLADHPLGIGPANDLRQFEVEVSATVDGTALPNLDGNNFSARVGGVPVEGVSAVQLPNGNYQLTVQPAGPLPEGLQSVSVSFAGASDTSPDAVIVGESPQAAVALVIDNSGSMGGSRIDAAKTAAQQFVYSMQEGDQVAVITFNGSASVRQPLVTLNDLATKTAIADLIGTITAGGSTYIGSGITAANGQLGGAQAGYARAQV